MRSLTVQFKTDSVGAILVRFGAGIGSSAHVGVEAWGLDGLFPQLGPFVQRLLIICGFPVDSATPNDCFARIAHRAPAYSPLCANLCVALRLRAARNCVEFSAAPPRSTHFANAAKNVRAVVPVPIVVHRFEELIAGHPYQIEVAHVAQDRWRANIMRLPGVPTALMPFYGTTPTDAADQLCQWLARAHARATDGARPV
jgi:hypothetical protein